MRVRTDPGCANECLELTQVVLMRVRTDPGCANEGQN